MPKRLYICEICGHHKSLTSNGKKQIVCIDCVVKRFISIKRQNRKIRKAVRIT